MTTGRINQVSRAKSISETKIDLLGLTELTAKGNISCAEAQ
jgi:hypothetical protein